MRALVASESINMRLYLYALPSVFFSACSREQRRIKIDSMLVLCRLGRSADGAFFLALERQIPLVGKSRT